MISPSDAVHFVASMFTLQNRNVRCFGTNEYESAIAHLGLTPEERVAVTQCYDRLMRLVQSEPGAREH